QTLPLLSGNDHQVVDPTDQPAKAVKSDEKKWSRKNPYLARVVENRLLSGPDSAKEIRHFSFDLGDSGLTYEAGDALGVIPLNNSEYVDLLIKELGAEAETSVAEFDAPLQNVLSDSLEIVNPNKDFIEAVEKRADDEAFQHQRCPHRALSERSLLLRALRHLRPLRHG
ncbi:MAG: hypothetical protein AAGB14_02580, partial [Verrucomicrobiota bacterium]